MNYTYDNLFMRQLMGLYRTIKEENEIIRKTNAKFLINNLTYSQERLEKLKAIAKQKFNNKRKEIS